MGKKKKDKDKIEKDENYLVLIPSVRDGQKWENEDGKVFVLQENKGFFNWVAQKFFGRPRISRIELDEFGSFVWLQIDGTKDITEIGSLVKEEFGDKAEPLYERLSKFCNTLHMLRYIELTRPGHERKDNNE